MRLSSALFFLALAFAPVVTAQDSRASVDAAKRKLETLQKQAIEFDEESVSRNKRSEIERLRDSSEKKGEFETTAQFEKRKRSEQARIELLGKQIEYDVADARCQLNAQISQVLASVFTTELNVRSVSLGTYDADSQRFPVRYLGRLQGFLSVPLADAPGAKDHFGSLTLVGVLGLSIDGQNRAQEYLLKLSATDDGKIYTADFLASLTKVKAAEIVFGNFDPANKVSTWIPSNEVRDSRDTSTIGSEIIDLAPIKFNSSAGLLFIAKEKDEDSMGCHACGRVLTYAIFEKTANGWKPEQVVRNAGE